MKNLAIFARLHFLCNSLYSTEEVFTRNEIQPVTTELNHYYPPQRSCGKVTFLTPETKLRQSYVFTRVCDSVHTGVSQHALQVSGGVVSQHALLVSRPTPRMELEGSGQGGSPGPHPGGKLRGLAGGVSSPTPRGSRLTLEGGSPGPHPGLGVYPSMH